MSKLSIDIEIKCLKCREVLRSDNRIDDCHGYYSVEVDPCEKCLFEALGEKI